MKINTELIASIPEANRNFSKTARLVDEKGVAAIMKNNAPRSPSWSLAKSSRN